ncbi:MAG TPA: FoF1 ATP synthase subunit a [Anaerolineales bacterium]|nr:FoF1 ATP synthase subunit a [Anaerolineales bacterium]
MENTEKIPHKRRWGFYRWLVVLIIVGNVFAARAFAPVMPHVQVPAENILGPFSLPIVGELYLTNTIIAMLIADLLLIMMALSVRLATRSGDLVLTGFPSVIEALIEGLYSLVESTAGKWARRIFPWMATIVLLVLVVNWMELIPGVDSIGTFHEPHHGAPAYETQELFSIGGLPISTITKEAEEHGSSATEAVGFTPFVRVTATDLNFTVALALISVVMTQVIGIQALGPGYFSKFLAFRNFGRMWMKERLGPFDVLMPFLDIFVGLLELVAEFAKIISFSFRLFGNIFAGAVLLFVIGSLVPVLVQSVFLLLEFMVGLIQALVFGMLTLVFMSMATHSHGDDGEEHAEAHS